MVQKRALKIIAGYDQDYQQTLRRLNLYTLADRRQMFACAWKKIWIPMHTEIYFPSYEAPYPAEEHEDEAR